MDASFLSGLFKYDSTSLQWKHPFNTQNNLNKILLLLLPAESFFKENGQSANQTQFLPLKQFSPSRVPLQSY